MSRRLSPEEITQAWAESIAEGWIDLNRLGRIAALHHRPLCGMEGCTIRARYVDPDGVGWCGRHRNFGIHPLPDFDTVRFGVAHG